MKIIRKIQRFITFDNIRWTLLTKFNFPQIGLLKV